MGDGNNARKAVPDHSQFAPTWRRNHQSDEPRMPISAALLPPLVQTSDDLDRGVDDDFPLPPSLPLQPFVMPDPPSLPGRRGRVMKVFAAGLLAAAALIVGYRLPHQSQPAVTRPAVAPLVTGRAASNPNSMAASNGPGLAADSSTEQRRIDLVQTQAASETSGRSVSEPGGGAPQPASTVVAVPTVDTSASLSASPTPRNGPGLAVDSSTEQRRIDLVQTQAASETSGRSVLEPGGDATGAPQPASISVAAVPRVDASASLSASPTPRRTSRRLEASEIAELLRRANQVAAKGDLVGARLLFQRAAEAGNSSAALAIAGTYDPLVLERLGERGLAPDVALARFWYEKARELGSKEAPQRLEMLASRTN